MKLTATKKRRHKDFFDTLDRQIDAITYTIYGLTDEEIKIVEGK